MLNTFFKYLLKNQFIAGLLFIAVVWLLFALRGILLAFFVSYIIMAALSPMVDALRKQRLPKTAAVIITFSLAVVLFLLLIVPLVPFFITQIQQLFKSFPLYLDQAASIVGVPLDVRGVSQIIPTESLGNNAFAFVGGVFGGVFSIITVLALSFYLLLDYDGSRKTISSLFPKKYQDEALLLVTQINEKLGAWLRGQIILSITIGLLTWIILTVLHMPFALPLAVLAGLLEIIPTIGPIIAAIPAVIVAFTISPNMALVIVVAYLVIQALENNLLVPRIMQRAVGLNPIAVIIGIIVGGQLLGVMGALLSVPFISLIVVVYKSLHNQLEG